MIEKLAKWYKISRVNIGTKTSTNDMSVYPFIVLICE